MRLSECARLALITTAGVMAVAGGLSVAYIASGGVTSHQPTGVALTSGGLDEPGGIPLRSEPEGPTIPDGSTTTDYDQEVAAGWVVHPQYDPNLPAVVDPPFEDDGRDWADAPLDLTPKTVEEHAKDLAIAEAWSEIAFDWNLLDTPTAPWDLRVNSIGESPWGAAVARANAAYGSGDLVDDTDNNDMGWLSDQGVRRQHAANVEIVDHTMLQATQTGSGEVTLRYRVTWTPPATDPDNPFCFDPFTVFATFIVTGQQVSYVRVWGVLDELGTCPTQ